MRPHACSGAELWLLQAQDGWDIKSENADFARGFNSTGEAKPYLGDLQIKPSQEEFLASHERRKERRRTR